MASSPIRAKRYCPVIPRTAARAASDALLRTARAHASTARAAWSLASRATVISTPIRRTAVKPGRRAVTSTKSRTDVDDRGTGPCSPFGLRAEWGRPSRNSRNRQNRVRIQFEFELHFRRARWLVTRALLLTSFAPLAVASSGRARANQNTFASEGLVGTQSPCSPFGLRAEWREAVAGKNCTACTKHNFSVRGLMSASF